jgi:hypothetical protein
MPAKPGKRCGFRSAENPIMPQPVRARPTPKPYILADLSLASLPGEITATVAGDPRCPPGPVLGGLVGAQLDGVYWEAALAFDCPVPCPVDDGTAMITADGLVDTDLPHAPLTYFRIVFIIRFDH